MILSVSRRTDIPAFYMPWFMNRLREGYVMVRNPMNYHQVSRVSLSPEVIDCIVFWTKNTMPLMPHLGEIALQYPFYIQYTLNPYGRDLEPGLPPLAQPFYYKNLNAQKVKEAAGECLRHRGTVRLKACGVAVRSHYADGAIYSGLAHRTVRRHGRCPERLRP